ncbi:TRANSCRIPTIONAL REGULATORY protein [Enhygromyxa salina]|uniref:TRANSCRIPTIONAL REGULATORY protein n=1 Tax=Enhygromyxa salina TaxID=215803 RepID=A0A0C2CTB1_9BACT|nr:TRANSCRIPTIONAL REGULATORY protein [Enhygromyxa salina]
MHRSITRKRSIDHRKHRVQPTQSALLDPKTPLDPEHVAAVSNNEKRTEDP